MAAFVRREPDREFSGDERLPGVEYTKRDRATTRSTTLLLAHHRVSFHSREEEEEGGGTKQIALLSPAVKFSTRWMRLNDLSDGKIA